MSLYARARPIYIVSIFMPPRAAQNPPYIKCLSSVKTRKVPLFKRLSRGKNVFKGLFSQLLRVKNWERKNPNHKFYIIAKISFLFFFLLKRDQMKLQMKEDKSEEEQPKKKRGRGWGVE